MAKMQKRRRILTVYDSDGRNNRPTKDAVAVTYTEQYNSHS